MNDKTLVTGGTGQVGKHLQALWPDAHYKGHHEPLFCDEGNRIIHLAAKVGGILDNLNNPVAYSYENIRLDSYMIWYALTNQYKYFTGILSTCVYPADWSDYPLTEEDLHSGKPEKTNFEYAIAKRALAVQIDAVRRQYGWDWHYLIPCNLYGPNDKYGENSHFVGALLKKICQAERNSDKSITLFGDGTPLRQFMYAGDLARVIKLCHEHDVYENMNVCNPENYSIKEIAHIALEATGNAHLEIKWDKSKPNGQHRKDASIDKFRSHFPGFEFTPLRTGIKRTYEIMKTKWEKQYI